MYAAAYGQVGWIVSERARRSSMMPSINIAANPCPWCAGFVSTWGTVSTPSDRR